MNEDGWDGVEGRGEAPSSRCWVGPGGLGLERRGLQVRTQPVHEMAVLIDPLFVGLNGGRALFQAALCAMLHDPTIKAVYGRKKTEGKSILSGDWYQFQRSVASRSAGPKNLGGPAWCTWKDAMAATRCTSWTGAPSPRSPQPIARSTR